MSNSGLFLRFLICQVLFSNIYGLFVHPEIVKFFRSYVDAHNFGSLSIYLPRYSNISIRNIQQVAFSLKVPLGVINIYKNPSFKLDEVKNGLAIAWVQSLSDPQFLQKVVFAKFSSGDDNLNASSSREQIQLMEAYQASPYLPYIVNELGHWTNQRGLKEDPSDPASRRTNLTGLDLNCVTMEQHPFTYLSQVGLGSEDVQIVKGFLKDVWDDLQAQFHFRYTCKKPRDNQWGFIQGGQWNGMVKEVLEGEADVIVTSFDYTPARAEAVQYLIGIKTVGYRLAVRRPGLMQSTWTSFTNEFAILSWIVTFIMVTVAPLVLAFVSYSSPFEHQRVSVGDAYLLTLGALFFQGSYINVSSVSTRVVFITIFLATLLTYAYYTSALVAHLTIASPSSTPFSTLQGLVNNGWYQLGFLRGTSLEENFKESGMSFYMELWENIVRGQYQSLVDDHATGLRRVKEDNYVYLVEENVFNFGFIFECDLNLLPMEYFRSVTTFAFAKKSPLVNLFNYHLSKLHDSGVLVRMWNRWQPPASLCLLERFAALSIEQTFTAFLILLAGVLISILICLPLERISRQSLENKITLTNYKQTQFAKFYKKVALIHSCNQAPRRNTKDDAFNSSMQQTTKFAWHTRY